MAIIKQTFLRYIGLSSDTKPTSSVPTNATFFETDTGEENYWNGSAWNLIEAGVAAADDVLVGTSLDTKPSGVPVGTMWMETDTEFLYWYDGADWKFVVPGGIPVGVNFKIGDRMVLSEQPQDPTYSEGPNSVHVTSTFASGGPASVVIYPKNPAGLADGWTMAGCIVFANEYKLHYGDYECLQVQSVKSASEASGARYDIVSYHGSVGGSLHPIYIGMLGHNKFIFNPDGSINANSLPMSNLSINVGGTLNFNGGIGNNCAAIRGISTANMAIRPNPNSTDATERSLVLQALDAGADAFNAVLTITPNGAAPRVTIDRDVDQKVISAPANPASGYVRTYPKVIDANNDGVFVKAKVQGAVEEIRAYP